jgi:hypothetical protein
MAQRIDVTGKSTGFDRRSFIGGSDARVIMGSDEAALIRLWQEKRGEVEPQDLSGNLIVQLGRVTEDLNRHWFERNTGQPITDVQRRIRHPVNRWMGATLDGRVQATGAVFEAKFMLPWSFSEEGAAEKHMAQLQHNMWVVNAKMASLSIITGGGKWVEIGHSRTHGRHDSDDGRLADRRWGAKLPPTFRGEVDMAISIEQALDHPLITVVKADKERGIFAIKIGKLKTVITIELVFDDLTELWWFEVSHAIKTPQLSGPYRPSMRQDRHRGPVLRDAIIGFILFYRSARRDGFSPTEDWLVKRCRAADADRHPDPL